MSYTNQTGQPMGTAKSIANKLREILIAEIMAINGYTEHIANSDMADVNMAWEQILADEKKHYAMIFALVRKYDPDQNPNFSPNLKAIVAPIESLQPFTPEYDRQIMLNNIRQDLKSEFEAIILYEEIIAQSRYSDINNALRYIIKDEKDHCEHLTQLMLKYEPNQYNGI